MSRFLFRPIGFVLTWLAIRIGCTTEGVAWLSGIVGIAGCVCLISGHQELLPLGIGLLLFFNLLDCVDGSIARTLKTENPYGRFLDSICGGVIDFAFWGAVGIMAFRHQELLVWKDPMGYGPFFWLAVGGFTCFVNILVAFLEKTFDKSLRQTWEELQGSKQNVTRTAEPMKNSISPANEENSNIRYVLRMINNNLRVRENHYLLLIIAYLSRTTDLFLIVYLLYYLSQYTILLITYAMRGRKIRISSLKINPKAQK
ncbi:MAG: CDP-alcohol phosphatidyltransferase family protein [Candidatus Sifarchaeia archaeon]